MNLIRAALKERWLIETTSLTYSLKLFFFIAEGLLHVRNVFFKKKKKTLQHFPVRPSTWFSEATLA